MVMIYQFSERSGTFRNQPAQSASDRAVSVAVAIPNWTKPAACLQAMFNRVPTPQDQYRATTDQAIVNQAFDFVFNGGQMLPPGCGQGQYPPPHGSVSVDNVTPGVCLYRQYPWTQAQQNAFRGCFGAPQPVLQPQVGLARPVGVQIPVQPQV